MELRVEGINGKYLYRILYILTGAVALVPVACNYIMSGGIVTEWTTRVMTLSSEPFCLFPLTGMNSNLWLFPFGLLHRFSGNMVLTYRLYMLMLQIGTLFFSKIFFERFYAEQKNRFMAFFGILLYMTNPYRIYICYDLADLPAATVWMLLPLYSWALLGILRTERLWKNTAVSIFVLAGIGYAHAVYFVILAGLTLLTVLWCKKALPLVTVAAGSLLFLPGLFRLIQYLFFDAYQEWNIPVHTIMQSGYRPGQIFSIYAFRDGHPGMGLAMLIGLLVGLWLRFVNGDQKLSGKERYFILLAVFLLLLSIRFFPWNLIQRMGIWALKLVSLINTPAIFAGLAYNCLCIPASYAAGRISKYENRLPAFAIPIFVIIAGIGICIYQCNTLTFTRLPLELP